MDCFSIADRVCAEWQSDEPAPGRAEVLDAIAELQADVLVRAESWGHRQPVPSLGLTAAGRDAVGHDVPMEVASIRLSHAITDPDLLRRCGPSFDNQEYDLAVMGACKVLEERLRERAGLGPSDIGHGLVNAALLYDKGVLRLPHLDDLDPRDARSEQDGLAQLFRGAFMLLRNAYMHRTVPVRDRGVALRRLALVGSLLDLLDTLVPAADGGSQCS